jgi:hypothetical protein
MSSHPFRSKLKCGQNYSALLARLLACAFAASLALSRPALAQTAPKSAPPAASKSQPFDPHDLSGVWDHEGRIPGDPAPPMTAWGQEKFNATKPSFGPRMVPPAFGNDPIGYCDPQGFPRVGTIENPQPMELIQVPGRLLQFFEWNHVWRTIWTDGRELPKDPDSTWYGYSVGKWEGDTLVVTTVGTDERTWLDQPGYPHSDQLRAEERYRRIDRDTLEYTLTIDDPKTYTKPWRMVNPMHFKLNPKYELVEIICAPSDEKGFDDAIRNPAAGVGVKK